MGKGGGGGGQPVQTTSTSYQTNIPEYARPYVETMLGATQKQLFEGKTDSSGNFNITGFKPYQPYSKNPSDYVAPFSPMQEQAMRTAASPEAFGQQVQGYMSPYMQDVVDVQKREAARSAGILGAQNQAQATNAGAFGGYREGIQRSENERNLMTQMNDIQKQGLQASFDNAQQQARIAQNLQMQYGGMQQSQQQQMINQAIQDYANAQQYPLMQLGTMSNMLRGLPMQAQTTNQYVATPNPITQGIGVAGAGASLYNATKGPGGASGGLPEEFKYASGGITSVPGYSVGGAIQNQLENMPIDELQKEAENSTSPTIRAMAKRILAEKQAEQSEASSGAQPAGPMGVQYEAPPVQSAAKGGILAFYEGGTKGKKTYDIGDDQNFKDTASGYVGAWQSGDQSAIDFYRTKMEDAAAKAQARAAVENEPQLVPRQERGIPQAVTRPAPSLPQLQTAENVASLTPAQKAEQSRLSGIFEAQRPKPAPAQATPTSTPAQATPTPTLTPTPVPSRSITTAPTQAAAPAQATTTPSPAPAKTGIAAVPSSTDFLGPDINAAISQTKTDMNKSAADIQKEETDKLKLLGVDTTNKAQKDYRQTVMSELANSADEAKRQRWMRAAQFFAGWGSTPGPLLAAGLANFQKMVPDLISDQKEYKKANRELNKMLFDIDEAIRLEEKGDYRHAQQIKEKTAERGLNFLGHVSSSLASVKSHQTTAAATIEAARHREKGETARAENAEAKLEEARRKNAAIEYQKSLQMLDAVEKEVAKEKQDTTYKTSKAALSVIKEGTPESKYTKYQKDAKAHVDAVDEDHKKRIQRAKDVVEAYKSSAFPPKEGASASGTVSKEKRPSLDDPSMQK